MTKAASASLDDMVLQQQITNRLLAAQLQASTSMKQQDLIALLCTTGASNRDIATILNTTPDVVRGTIRRLKIRTGQNGKGDAAAEQPVDVS
jgi:DNA-binding CsgD family transcriptional regulator